MAQGCNRETLFPPVLGTQGRGFDRELGEAESYLLFLHPIPILPPDPWGKTALGLLWALGTGNLLNHFCP